MVEKVGIAGAGTMGSTIAQIFAQMGYAVVLYDISQDSINRGLRIISNNQENMLTEGLLDKEKAGLALERIRTTTDINMLSGADLILEAIVEKLSTKQTFWREVSKVVDEDTLLATNTSGLSITRIAEGVDNRQKFAGMHWWNPPHLIPLVEIIMGEETAEETAGALMELARSLGKKPVLVKKDVPGFIGNRLQYALLREALYIVEQGIADAEDVDEAVKYGLGLRYSGLGPIETVDLGGVDIFVSVGSYLFSELNNDSGVPEILRSLYEDERLGVKSGQGFFDYSGNKGKKVLQKRDSHLIKMKKFIHRKDNN